MDREPDREQDDEAIALHTTPPRTRRLNRKNLRLASLVIGLIVAAALYASLLHTSDRVETEAPQQVALSNDLGPLAQVGTRYADRTPPAEAPPQPAPLQPFVATPSPRTNVVQRSPIFKQETESADGNPALNSSRPYPSGGGSNDTLNPRDAENRQDEKLAFAAAARKPPMPQAALPRPMLTPYTLKSGTIIPGILITGLNSDLPGQVLGQVSQPVYDSVSGRHLLIPQGSRVISEYNSVVTYGQERVQVASVSLHLPNGSTVDIGALPVVDQSGYTGLTGNVDNHWDRVVAAIGAVGAMSYAGSWIASKVADPSGTAAMMAMLNNSNQVGNQIVQKQLQIQPTITLPPGSRFNIMLSRDLIIPPYKGQSASEDDQ